MSSFCKCKSYSHFFSKNISIYAIFNDQSFNDTLTNNIVSFWRTGPRWLRGHNERLYTMKLYSHKLIVPLAEFKPKTSWSKDRCPTCPPTLVLYSVIIRLWFINKWFNFFLLITFLKFDISCESSAQRWFTWNVNPYFSLKIKMLSAAVVTGTLKG